MKTKLSERREYAYVIYALCFLMIFFSDIITYAINGAIVGAILGFVIALLIHVFKKRPEKKAEAREKKNK